MSENEKRLRDEYQALRKKRLRIILAVALSCALLTAACGFTYVVLDKKTYIAYECNGKAVYKAYLAENEFYEQEYLNGSHAYVAELIDRMRVDFNYRLKLSGNNVRYKYSYKTIAVVEVKDKTTGMAIYNPEFNLLSPTSKEVNVPSLDISDGVNIDYKYYNKAAGDFIKAYDLKNVVATLYVRTYINVVGAREDFKNDLSDIYTIEVSVPLVQSVVAPSVKVSAPKANRTIIALNASIEKVFGIISIVFGAITVLGFAFLIAFSYFTRDKHIDYARRVSGLLSSYRSYIQKITNKFPSEGYTKLLLSEFSELLEIRDTLQAPVLMYENDDRTKTEFFVTTPDKLMYVFEVCVNDDFGAK